MLAAFTSFEIMAITLFFSFLALFLFVLLNDIYFYKKHYQKLSEAIDGAFVDHGFLLAMNKLTMWGHYCLFPKRAQRDNVLSVFEALPKSVRSHLISHWIGLLACGFLMVSSYLVSTYI
ncbi:hypothetical protein [Endozoicomonas numazuensis]|uniref:Universal stress protein B n=1 Tax=Endozoicomonas numazuensis TaxID=1137799 RepID=A0A081NLN6_9GAMM|nr:hypothetical protein [Endozoicomonas numazuensis]KEQ19359.1 hypothetical protein GZ78_05190 [Endozoicomonas numazuensis]